jgi:hypothetical protein
MKLDRLLSRIRAALSGYASEFELRALADEYVALCAKAAQRLEQVVPLIREGQDFPALQIAESPPSVLDLVRQLSFAEADQWRTFCRQRSLPAAPPFDERSVDLVNQLYGKKISETHPLYREYRQAIRTRHDEQALRVLQSIRRINHDDANAHAEFARLAHKLFERRRGELAGALDRSETARVLELMDAFEADDWPGRDEDPTWRRALKFREEHQLVEARARCLDLAGQLRQLRDEGRWQDALPALAEWDGLRGQFTFTLPPDTEAQAAGARDWAAGLLAERVREQDREKSWRNVAARLNELDAENPAKKPAPMLVEQIAELTAQSSTLAAQAQDHGRTPPPELVQRLEGATATLRRQLRRRKLVFAGVTVTVIILVVGGAAVAIRAQVRRTNQQAALTAIAQDYKDGAAGALADALKTYDTNFGGSSLDDETAKSLEQAQDYAKTHLAALDRFNQELAVAVQAAVKPSPNQIAGLLKSLDSLDQEAGDFGAGDAQYAKAAVQELRLRLNQKLAGDQDARTARLADIFARADQVVTQQLDNAQTADAAQAAVVAARKITTDADEITVDPSQRGLAEDATFQKLTALIAKLDLLGAAANSAIASRAQLAQARSIEDYQAAIETLAPNPLSSDPDVAAAHALAVKKPDWAGAAQHILLPNDPETWAYLGKITEPRLEPTEDNQQEDINFSHLTHNGVFDNPYRAELVSYANGTETGRQLLFLAGQPTSEENTIETIHEITMTGKVIQSDGTTTNKIARWAQFTGQKANGDKFENVQIAPEAKLIALLEDAYDKDRSTIREPLLRVLDEVRANADASPLLKAYFQQELYKIMQSRPRDWGLTFSPTAKSDAAELSSLTGGHLETADWLFPPANSLLPKNLQSFYQRTGGVSYVKEAMANLQDLLKQHATPVFFAGSVGLDDAPRLTGPAPEGATLWGFNTGGDWRPLYAMHGGQITRTPGGDAPARLTPLVYIQENAAP